MLKNWWIQSKIFSYPEKVLFHWIFFVENG